MPIEGGLFLLTPTKGVDSKKIGTLMSWLLIHSRLCTTEYIAIFDLDSGVGFSFRYKRLDFIIIINVSPSPSSVRRSPSVGVVSIRPTEDWCQ